MPDINISMNLNDHGSIKDKTNDTKELNKELTRAQNIATKMAPVRAGYRSTGSGRSSGSNSSIPSNEGVEYGQARAAGGTGAAGRDFAKQAQGLGGLVHVYATFAANLFAVSAAFTALKNAADTSNMVKGLDQLGAASGTALGSLAKQLTQVSDGALSFRDAMEATTKGSAAGLTRDQMLKMADVAKKASQALGISMPDAMSRLSRGISKLEPELLDELGIYTKLDKSTQDYARSIGKTSASLTDFERRQAFANSVLGEGSDKFNKISIDANPYDKLLASLKNTAQNILESVNTLLGPVIKLLSESPTGLMLSIMGIVGLLLKQAIPALSGWRDGLRATAEQAAKTANANKEFFDAYKDITRMQAATKLPKNIQDLGEAAQAGMDKAGEIIKNGARLYNRDFNNLFKIDQADLAKNATKVLDDTEKKLQAAVVKAQKAGDPTKAQARLETFQSARPEIEAAAKSAKVYSDAIDKNAPKVAFWAKVHNTLAADADLARKKYTILANAADNATFIGPINAFNSMVLSIKSLGTQIGLTSKILLGIKGTVTIAAAAISTLASAFGNVLSIVGLVTAGLSLFVDWLSDNKEKAAIFTDSLNAMTDSGTSAYRTLEYLSKLDPLEKLSTASIVAKSNALSDLVSTTSKAFDDLQSEITGRGTVDKITNAIYSIFDKDYETKFAKQLSTNIQRSLALAGTYAQQSKLKLDLASLLGIDKDSSIFDISKAISSAIPSIQKAALDMLSKVSNETKKGAQAFKSFDDQLDSTSKAYDDLLNTFRNTSPLFKFAEEGIRSVNALQDALTVATPEEGLAKLSSLSDNYKFLKTLPTEAATSILKISQTLKEQAKAAADAEASLQGYDLALSNIDSQLSAKRGELDAGPWLVTTKNRLKEEIANLELARGVYEKNISTTKKLKNELANAFQSATTTFNNAFVDTIKNNVAYLEQGLTQAMSKASISVNKAYLGLVSDEGVRAKESEKLNRQGIQLEIQNVKLNASMIEAQKDLKLAILENTLAVSTSTAAKEAKNIGKTKEQIIASTPELSQQKETIDTFKASRNKSLTELAAGMGGRDRGGNTIVSAGQARAFNELMPFAAQTAATQGKLTELAAAIETSKITDIINDIADTERRFNTALDNAAKTLENEKAAFELNKGGMTEAEILAKQTEFTKTSAELAYGKAVGPAAFAAQRAQVYAGKNLPGAAENLSITQGKLDTAIELSSSTERNTKALDSQKLTNQQILKDDERRVASAQSMQALEDAKSSAKLSELSSAKELLDVENSFGLLSAQEYADKLKVLQLEQLSVETAKQKRAIESKRDIEVGSIEAQIKQTGRTKEDIAALEKKSAAVTATADVELAAIDKTSQARRTAIDLQGSLTELMKGFGKIVQDTFAKLGDSLVDFAKTGKHDFKGLVNSMIEDLARFAIRAQMMKMFAGATGAGGILDFLSPSAGSSAGQLSNPFAGMSQGSIDTALAGIPLPSAKGNVFGVEAFAKGGAFTNSVVSSPTLFKFAQGTGLMGEAGPEAIMPLKRDSQGNLGVRTNQQQTTTQVVVNNYGSEQATTKETTDSKGNRKIEVIIGELVSREMSRPNSPINTSLKSNFQVQPTLVRR